MKLFYTAAAVAALATSASAAKCQNLTIPVTISARNAVFNYKSPNSSIEITNFILNLSQQGANYSQKVLQGYTTLSGTYNIAATYCTPDSGYSSTVQILTHGIGFDRGYWDFPYNNYNYSYVREAVDQYGFSTFAYDRLGIGMSDHGDPLSVVQAPLEVAALKYLTDLIRRGSCPSINHTPKKVVHVGHSFGSQHTYALVGQYPGISDGIALTGFSQNGSFAGFFLLGSNWIQANTIPALSSYANGYLAPASQVGAQIDFFAPNSFDPNLLPVAYAKGQPVTVGELLTFTGETAFNNSYAGPTLIITGERDIPYCGGNCLGTGGAGGSIPQQAFKFLPNAKNPQAIVVPGSGHGLNFEYSHPYTYAQINNYFVQNGLGPQ